MSKKADHVVPVVFMEGRDKASLELRQGYLGVGTDPERPGVAYFGEVINGDTSNARFSPRFYYLDENLDLERIAEEGLTLDAGGSRDRVEVPATEIQRALRKLPAPLTHLSRGDNVVIETADEASQEIVASAQPVAEIDLAANVMLVRGVAYDRITGLGADGETQIHSDTALDGSTISEYAYDRAQQTRYVVLRQRMDMLLSGEKIWGDGVSAEMTDHHRAQLKILDDSLEANDGLSEEMRDRGVSYFDRTLWKYDLEYRTVRNHETNVERAAQALQRAMADQSGSTEWSRQVVIPAHGDGALGGRARFASNVMETTHAVLTSRISRAQAAVPLGYLGLVGEKSREWEETYREIHELLRDDQLSTDNSAYPRVKNPVPGYVLALVIEERELKSARQEALALESVDDTSPSPEHRQRLQRIRNSTPPQEDQAAASPQLS